MNTSTISTRRGEIIRKGMRATAEDGKLPHCPPPGYMTDYWGGEKRTVLDTTSARLVWEAFFLALRGEHSVRAILKIVSIKGLLSRRGAPLSVKGLWGILTNPFYAGFIRYEGKLIPAKHQAIVDPWMFEKVQENLRRRRRRGRDEAA